MNNKFMETVKELNSLKETYDLELLEELVNIFVTQKEALINDMRNRQNFPDDDLRSIAHKIKSSARNVGAKKVGIILEEMEKKPHENKSKSKIDELESEINFFIDTFHAWKGNKGLL